MNKNLVESQYPDRIDPLIFFQDLNSDKEDYFKQFIALVSDGKYEEALAISKENGFDLVDSDLLNCIQNRLFNVQDLLYTKDHPKRHFYDDESAIAGWHFLVDGDYDFLETDEGEKIPVAEIGNGEIWVSSYVDEE